MARYVWYLGYGSNLSQQRFLCYIEGGTPRYGKNPNKGSRDKTAPVSDRSWTIDYHLYFALPAGMYETSWGRGGVAFIKGQRTAGTETLCRLWKITIEQYEDVKEQEGSWYTRQINLGTGPDDLPMYTFTNEENLTNVLPPSQAYLKTIAEGLRETYHLDDNAISHYLMSRIYSDL